MSLKLSDWASIGEIVSSLAVVVTLVFLIADLRESTETTRAASYDRNLESLIQIRMQAVQDEELSAIFRRYWEGNTQELDRDERFRLWIILSSIWGVFEKAYFANEYGTMGLAEWERFARAICSSRARVTDDAEWSELELLLSEAFRTHIAENCVQ